MGRRPIKDKKMPNEYPQFAFRVTKDNKKRLASDIEAIQLALNRRRNEGDPYINKNDVIVRALNIGLKELRSK